MTTPLPCPRPSRKREAILDAAQASFLELGYAAASMDLLAARAAVSKATIYAHFAGKEELFAAVITRRCERELWGPGLWPEGKDARTTLTTVAMGLVRLLDSPEVVGMYRVVVAEAVRQPDLARVFWENGPGRGKAGMCAMFEDLTRRGQLTVPDCWAAADQFSAMMRGEVFQRMLLNLPLPDHRTLERTAMAAVETLLRAYGG
jgi:TetR/AcrR family transcriptional regulator, mexJK operon transcriptional repressor